MTNGYNPEGDMVNGEPATDQEIFEMEGLAYRLLADFPAEYHRQYRYQTEAGAIAVLATHLFEEELDEDSEAKNNERVGEVSLETVAEDLGKVSLAVLCLAHESADDLKLQIVFDTENKPKSLFYRSDEDLSMATSLLQDLIEYDEVQAADAAVLRHLQAIVFCILGSIVPEDIGLLASADPSQKTHYVGDLIRSQVDKNTTCAIRSKVWGLPIGDDGELTVASNVIVGELSEEDDVEELPLLKIEYLDRRSKVIYIYVRSQYGEATLNTTVGLEKDRVIEPASGNPIIDAIAEASDLEEVEEIIASFRESLGSNIPGRQDVLLLTNMLRQAVLIDT